MPFSHTEANLGAPGVSLPRGEHPVCADVFLCNRRYKLKISEFAATCGVKTEAACTFAHMPSRMCQCACELKFDCVWQGSAVNPYGPSSVQSQHSVCNERENQ